MTTEELTLPFGDDIAIPVRAIPYMTNWELSPTSIASALARNHIDVIRCLSNRFSYRLVGGELEPVLQTDWNAIIKKLGALNDSLEEKYPDERPNGQRQFEWAKKAIEILPAGVFVWLDEFEEDYNLEISAQPTRCVLKFKPLLSSAQRTEVMEGFKSFAHVQQSIIALPVSRRQVSAQNVSLRAKRELASQRAEADYRSEEAARQVTEAQIKQFTEELAAVDVKPILAMIPAAAVPDETPPVSPAAVAHAVPLSLTEHEAYANAAYDETGLNGDSINWRFWVHQMPLLDAGQAARLMSGLEPDLYDDLNKRPGRDDPAKHFDKARKIQRLAVAEGNSNLSPTAWLEWARLRQLSVHVGFRLAVQELAASAPTTEHPEESEALRPHANGGDLLPALPAAEPAVKGLTTAQIAQAFEGLVNFRLSKAMTDGAAWTSDARLTTGTRGGKHKSLWNPVIMATALRERKSVPMSKLNHVFNAYNFLADWREEWNRFSTM